jgi:conjugative relaxase-like TrwC/TraI family protein
MLFINHATDATAAKEYFTDHLSRSDYYLRDAAEIAGEWHGRGAERLGLSVTVDKESYFRLCENINPLTGEPLTPRTKAERRVVYDFTFDAPKSVTLAYELGEDTRILDKVREAVEETMGEMENAMRVRVRKDGSRGDRASGNMIWGEFIHRTTRPVDGMPDPQLHVHAVAINASYDRAEDRWKAGEFSSLVSSKGYYQAAFHSRLARKLAALGYGIERDGTSFRLRGIDRATCDEFSRRSRIIEAEARRLGLNTPEGRRALGKRTREAKPDTPLSMAELRDAWRKRISDAEHTAIVESRGGQETYALDADEAVDYSLSHCFERASTVTQKKLLQTALIRSYGKANVEDVRGAAERPDILQKDRNGQPYVTTRGVLQEEIDLANFVRDGKATRRKLGGDGPVEANPDLSTEQQEAMRIILTSRDRVTALKGGAGTGKTRMMQATVAAIEKTGSEVFTFAPSADASRGVLRGEGFANAETVERLLIDPDMQKQVSGQVLWVDEAGLLSVRDMTRLFDVAKEQNARIVLSGDTAQHNAVLRGDALRILEKNAAIRTAALTQIRRQSDAGYREAVKAISEGAVPDRDGRTGLERGLQLLDGMGSIIETQGDARYRQIAQDYADVISQRKANGECKSSLVVAPTHAEMRHVTDAIRETLKQQGKLTGTEREFTVLRPRNLTEAERTDCANYQPGEIVQFHQNAKGFKRGERVRVISAGLTGVRVMHADGAAASLPFTEVKKFQLYRPETLALAEGDRLRITMNGFVPEARAGLRGKKTRLNNGDIYQVEGFTRRGDIELNNGFVVPKDYGGISYGYATTSHASQGKTVDVPLVALGSESFAAANREQLYVSLSRGREAVRLYTDDKAAMMEAVQGTSARLSATELMAGEPQALKRKAPTRERLYGHARRAFSRLRERIAAHDFITAHEAQQRRKGPGHER